MVITSAGKLLNNIEGKVDRKTALDVRNLSITFDTDLGPLDVVRDVSLQIAYGEIYGLVGESGSGKTTLARAIARYLPANGKVIGGSVRLDETNLLAVSRPRMQKIWGSRITMVHQDPGTSVNPSMTVGEQIAETAQTHLNLDKTVARAKAIEMLEKVRMPDPELVAERYPHQMSGGMLQRVLIAIAITTSPQLLIMDEPTTSLDVTTEAVILDLIRDLLKEYNMGVLFITHNLGVVARICNRIGVLYAGTLMEEGNTHDFFKYRLHPYTRGLLGCVPSVDTNKKNIRLKTIPGYIPRPNQLPDGCVFSPRCYMAKEKCFESHPALAEVKPGHTVACHYAGELHHQPEKDGGTQQKQVETDDTKKAKAPVVLETHEVKKHFTSSGGLSSIWQSGPSIVKAVDGISIKLWKGLTTGIVGESGCGKTTFARSILGLEEADTGKIELEGKPLSYRISRRPNSLLKRMQMVFQNPDASLNPHYPVGDSVARPLVVLHGKKMSKGDIQEKVKELFQAVRLPEDYIYRLPHELSGGEKQRVAIARAFASDPTLIILDEPISSLDLSVQASLMNLLVELQQSRETSYLFISHDLAAVRHLSDYIAVVYLGQICEEGLAEEVFASPHHPYTEALLSAMPVPDPSVQRSVIRLHGSVPSAVNIPSGCRFHTRCPRKIGEICEQKEPPWQHVDLKHRICCHLTPDELLTLQGGTVRSTGSEREGL